MPVRSKTTIAADWYVIVSRRLVTLIESTAGLSDANPKSPTDDEVLALIRELDRHATELKGPPPCWVEVWVGEGHPLPQAVKGWTLQEVGWAEDNDGAEICFLHPDGPRRLHTVGAETVRYFDMDADPKWYWYDHSGKELCHVLEWWLERRQSQAAHRTPGKSPVLYGVDLAVLADDLTELNERLQEWIAAPADSPTRNAVQRLVDRIWLRLNDGEIDLIDASQVVRAWLWSVWTDLLWVQRWLELNRAALFPVWTFETDLGQLRFDEHVTTARSISTEAKPTAPGAKQRKNSVSEINMKMWKSIQAGPDAARKLTLDDWAQVFGCSKSTVHKTDAWTKMNAMRKASSPRR